jgi:syntaxin 1B/2/3
MQRFSDNVTLISKLQDRSLNSIGDTNIQEQINRAVQETSSLMNSLRDRIKALQAQGGNSDAGQIRRGHVSINTVSKY